MVLEKSFLLAVPLPPRLPLAREPLVNLGFLLFLFSSCCRLWMPLNFSRSAHCEVACIESLQISHGGSGFLLDRAGSIALMPNIKSSVWSGDKALMLTDPEGFKGSRAIAASRWTISRRAVMVFGSDLSTCALMLLSRRPAIKRTIKSWSTSAFAWLGSRPYA